jgi:tRNA threonylcarbamoyladenosine biosynthesis protein TsaB
MNQTAPILAIDTSTDFAGIALLGGDTRVALTWDAGRNQTTSMLDQVDRCLRLAGLAPAQLGGVAIAIGPGMFTSLRVGVSLAKGLAIGLDLPVVGVSTLEVAAQAWIGLDREIVAVVSVGRGRVVWQRFSATGDAFGEPVNSSDDELREALTGSRSALVVGEVPEALAAECSTAGMVVRHGDAGRRDPLLLAQLGRERLAQRGPDDLTALQPTYVHSRSAAVSGV